MSSVFYIALAFHLTERPHPHDKMVSVNEALQLGYEDIPSFMLEEGFTVWNEGMLDLGGSMGTFKIDVDDFQWIGGAADDPEDLCLHGHVKVQIGDVLLEDDGTVSATALYLLKTLTEDKIMDEMDIQMIPCCGHSIYANKELTDVMICGCDNGTDWSTIHEGDNVKLILPTGQEVVVLRADYKVEVFHFADKVEAFYKACTPKILPQDEIDRNGYIAFWNEWHRRRKEEVLPM